MKRKIVFYYSKLNIGGAERSLTRMMNSLAREGHDIVLLTKYSGGTCEPMLDSRIQRYSLAQSNMFCSKKGAEYVLGRMWAVLQQSVMCIKLYLQKGDTDLLVLGSQGMIPVLPRILFHPQIIAKCIRNDLSKCRGNNEAVNVIKKFDSYVDYYLCVSKTTKESLDYMVPEVSGKSIVYYNFLDVEEMRRKLNVAANPFSEDGKIHIVTVCRVSDKAKGVFRMLDVCERLLRSGYQISWYIVGAGEDFDKLEREVVKRNMTDSFVLTGQKDNPFGYYKSADLVAVLSYYEGLCGVVNEAKVAGAPVIATEFSGIHEQLEHSVNGWIVENNEDAIFEGIQYLLDNPKELSKMRNTNYPKEILDDEYKINKLYSLLGWCDNDD